MSVSACASLLLLSAAAATPQDPGRVPDVTWTDAVALGVRGRGFEETSTPYSRLPARAEGTVRDAVWNLSQRSAGLHVDFVTDAPELRVRWRLTSDELAMPHMAASGVSGVDLYLRTDEGWRWVANGRPSARDAEARLVGGLAPAPRTWRLYLPLYNGVESLAIGVPAGAEVTPAPPPPARPIVFYGTSITQGACASRPGMAHVAILGRRLDAETVNLGFSGNGRMEPELALLLGEIDADAFVLDCLPNMSAAMVEERLAPFVRLLRERRPDTPIVLVEDRTYGDAWIDARRAERNRTSRAALRAAYAALVAEGVPALSYVEGDPLLGDDGEATVDGSHPTDLGFTRQADVLEAALREILGS